MNIASRASGYGMGGCACDGNYVFDVYKVASKAVERARKAAGPSLVHPRHCIVEMSTSPKLERS